MYFSDGGHENIFLATFLLRSPWPNRDGPISIPNTRYYQYQGLEEKYRILAGNIDYFDTAEPAIFGIVASGLMIKMTVLFLNLFFHYFYYYLFITKI